MSFTVDIIAGATAAHSSIQASGSQQHVITSTEIQTYGLQDSSLKKAVGAYFGKQPDDAYLKSPTPWGDLFISYGWPQTQTILRVRSATITGIDTKPTILATKILENNSSVEGQFGTGISETVTNTVETGWSMSETLSFTQTIKYSASFLGTGVSGETSFGFEMGFGQSGSQSVATEVGSTSDVKVTLKPGESVRVVLSASSGTLKARVVYDSYLTGTTAVNYSGKYQGHYFWGLGTPNVMSSGGISNSKTVTQDIEVGYYSEGKVSLEDVTRKSANYESAEIPEVYMRTVPKTEVDHDTK